jgi:hypothetical protein
MAKFLLLLRTDPKTWSDLSPDEMQAIMRRFMEWDDQLRAEGRKVSADQLVESTSALVSGAGDDVSVVDGPYIETKESVGGFWIVNAADRAEAIEVAKGCPNLTVGGTVEVIQVMELAG